MSFRAVACSRPASPEDGYATPSALIFALALALIASAMMQRSTALLRQSRADLERTQMAYTLDGAQLAAAAAIVRSGAGGRYRWALATDAGWVEAVAESEGDKVSLAGAAALGDRIFQALDVRDIEPLKARLAAAAGGEPLLDVSRLDAAPLWRVCAPSVISTFGARTALQPTTIEAPHMGDLTPAWRVGEVWRMQVTTTTGWRDERIVRFTGDALHPAAVVLRRLSRGNGGQGQCDAILAAAGAA
jgi:hypothetical protein